MAKSNATKTAAYATTRSKTLKDNLPAKEELFAIETSVGVIRVPKIRLTAAQIFDPALENDAKGTATTRLMITSNADETAQELIFSLDAVGEDSEFAEFMQIWQRASGIDLGESKASDS